MAEPQTNSNSSTASANSSSSSSSSSNSSNTTVNTSVDYVEIVDDEDDDDEGGSDEGCCDQPKVVRLGKADVIVVRINRGELTSAKYHTLAEQTAAKFKAVFPNNNILVIPNSTNFTVVKQPEVH